MANRLMLSLGVVAFCAVNAIAADKKLTRDELPAAVQKAADEQSRGAIVRGYSSETEDGQKEYEVAMTVDGHSKDVTFAPDGQVMEIEEEVTMDSLSQNVQAVLKKRAGKGKITKIESLTKHGKVVAYEAKLMTAGKHRELQVGPEGQTLAREE